MTKLDVKSGPSLTSQLQPAPVGKPPAIIGNRATRRKNARKNNHAITSAPSIAALPPDPRLLGRDTVGQLLHDERMKRNLATNAERLWQTAPGDVGAQQQAIIDWIWLSISNNADRGFEGANGPGIHILGELMSVKAGYSSNLIPKKGWRGDNKSIRPTAALGWVLACVAYVAQIEIGNSSTNEAADAVIDAIIAKIGAKQAKNVFDIRNKKGANDPEAPAGVVSSDDLDCKREGMRNRLINYHAKLVGGESLIPRDIDAGGLDYKLFRNSISEVEEARQKGRLPKLFNAMIKNACAQFLR